MRKKLEDWQANRLYDVIYFDAFAPKQTKRTLGPIKPKEVVYLFESRRYFDHLLCTRTVLNEI